jgi:hypothetical protein
VSAGLGQAVVPAFAAVELGDEREPAAVGGVQVADQFGDLRLEFRRREPAACIETHIRIRTIHDALRQLSLYAV